MGSSGTKKELYSEGIKAMVLESIKSLPEDEYTCQECDLVPEIINIDYATCEITIDCSKHGRQTIPIFDYIQKESQFIYQNAVCDIDYKTQKDNIEEIFNYCPQCKINLCGTCSKKHCHKKTLIELKNKNSKCHHNEEFIKFCKTCKKHLCKKEEEKHDKNHIIENFIEPTEEEIESIKDKKKYLQNQIKNYECMIKLLDIILKTHENNKSNYYYNLNIINISQNIKNDEILILRRKNDEFEKLYIEIFNNKYKANINKEDIDIDLTGKKIEKMMKRKIIL